MATYKVLQDVEAEDKLVGPLSLRQFVYAIICIVCLYLSFLMIKQHVPYFAVIFLPPALLTGFFAFPWGREQPTELWALARLRFFIKPRRRVWDQSGVTDFVTVTAPKKIEINYTNGLSETEVSSRLKALADVIDSHGWATKNVDPAQVMSAIATGNNPADSDRLVAINTLPEIPMSTETTVSDDVLDEQNNPVAKQFEQMLDNADTSHRERILQEMKNQASNQPAVPVQTQAPQPVLQSVAASTPTQPMQQAAPQVPQNNYWFANQQPLAAANQGNVATPLGTTAAEPTPEEAAMLEQYRAQNQDSMRINYSHMHALQPAASQPAAPPSPEPTPAPAPTYQTPVTRRPNPATLNYAGNDDLSIATIARQVNQNPPDEVVISLH